MIKKMILPLLLMATVTNAVMAQPGKDKKEEKEGGFKKENLFTGGSITASFFSGGTILGASPILGYRLANWIDAGLVFNINYTGIRDYKEFDDKVRQTTYGGGVFTRVYPVNFIFLQGQLEHDFTKFRYIPATTNYAPFHQTDDANSLLVGAGYTTGRRPNSNTFFYLAVLVDVLREQNSPYVDLVYDPATGQTSVRSVPIIRAGINVGLFEHHHRYR